MATYQITLTEAEDKALSYVSLSQLDWIENVAKNRCRIAIDEIVKICVEKCLETNTQIPGSKEEMVLLAFQQNWVKTVAEVSEERSNQLINN